MADLIDLAAARIEAQQQHELRQFHESQERAPLHFDGIHCSDCDIDIPERRLALGCFRCVDCQHHHEQKAARR